MEKGKLIKLMAATGQWVAAISCRADPFDLNCLVADEHVSDYNFESPRHCRCALGEALHRGSTAVWGAVQPRVRHSMFKTSQLQNRRGRARARFLESIKQ